ncbi:hypothetical protein C8Q70DRAFT_344858 [Cubamyces menziesii]|nr:hypothetical protein C8Q70DRAFT_344858 [Cubamyces menziesii]
MTPSTSCLSLRVSEKHSVMRSETREQKKADLRKLISLTGEDLGRLAHIMVIEALCEGFVDLSGFDLSIPTIVELFTQLQRYLTQLQQNHPPLQQVRSLSIARNPHVRLDDIPPLLETFPHIRRLNIMGCPAIDGDELIALMREAPAAFRTLEGLQHSSLLTHDKPPSYPIAFSFICTFYPRTLISVCLATFTLDQIFRALIDILLVLWAEHQRDTSPEVAVQIFFDSMMKNLIPMHMFKYQGPLITRTEFSYTGCEWEQPRRRPVISVPGPAHALVSDTPEGSWAFSLQWDTLWGGRSWGFVNYDTPISRDTDPFAPGGDYGMRAAGQVCDLRGFIRCMVDEGRPCPSPELVEKLEAVLYAKCGDVEGTLVCPLLRQEDALPAFYRLPDPSFIRPRYLGDTSRDFALDELILKMRAGPGSMYSRYMGDYPPFPDGFSQDEPDGELYDEPNDEPNDELGQVDSEPDEDADDGSDEDEVDDEYGRDYE